MPTFDTPKPISATIDLGLGDVRITAGDRATTVVDVRPSDPSNDEDTRAAERDPDRLRGRAAADQGAEAALSGCPAATADRSTSPSSCPPARTSAAARRPRTSAATGALGTCRIKIGLGDIEVEQAATCTSRAGPATSPSTTRPAPPSSRRIRRGARARARRRRRDQELQRRHVGRRGRPATCASTPPTAASPSTSPTRTSSPRPPTATSGWARSSAARSRSRPHIGDLEVGIREGTAAWLDVSARAGKVHNALTAADAPGPPTERVEVRARTSVGDVVIRRP